MNQKNYKHDSEYRAQVRTHILNMAKQLLSGKIGAIVAARELRNFWDEVEPELQPFLMVFVGIDSETDALPLGDVRKHWQPEALVCEDIKITDAEKFFHNRAIESADKIIQIIEKLPQ